MSQTIFKSQNKKQTNSAKLISKGNQTTAPKATKQIPKKLNYDSKIPEMFEKSGNVQKKLNFSEYVFLSPKTPAVKTDNENINLTNCNEPKKPRKISENYESYDETKSVSSLKTNSSVKYKTPKKTRKDDFKVKYKTEICKYWEIEKSCKFGVNCAFAHGNTDVKQKYTWSSYKTKKCKQFFNIGYCPYGNRCQFRHNQNYENYSYVRTLCVSEAPTIRRPRLGVFQDLVKDSDSDYNYIEEALKLKNENSDETGEDINLSRSRVSSF